MGTYLFFVSAVDADGEPTDDATWLDTHVKTSYTWQFEKQAASLGLSYTYPRNGAPATVQQLRVYARYLHLLKHIYSPNDDDFFEHDAMEKFVTENGATIETGKWFWHQG